MRLPHRLPTRFLPPARPPHRGRWAAALAASVALVFLALATATQPATTIVLSGLFGHLVPAAASPGPTAVPTTTGSSRGQHAAPGVGSTPAAPSPVASPTPTPADAAQPATPTPAAQAQPAPTASSGGGILPITLPPLLPTPTPAPSASPTPKKCILGLICL
jgi:hypothetical protein